MQASPLPSPVFHENLLLVAFALVPLASSWILLRFVARRGGRPVGALRVLTANLLLLLALLGGIVFAGEAYFRFGYDTTDSFALTKTHQRWMRRHFEPGPGGFRDDLPAYPLRRRPGRPRISFLGDSFTAGHGVADVEDRFANLVRRRRPGWEVHVLAQPGWNTPEQLAFLREGSGDYELDEVVLVYCPNDIASFDPRSRTIVERIYQRSAPTAYLTRHSYLFNFLHHRILAATLPEVQGYWDFALTAFAGAPWERQKRVLRALRAEVEGRGGRLHVITFPFLHRLDPENPFRPIHRELSGFWRREGVAHLDLLEAFQRFDSRELTVNRHDAHPNERAHALAADAIVPFLDAQLGRGR